MHRITKANDNSIDFDFFETYEDDNYAKFDNENKHSSKIVTKAVIETNPKVFLDNINKSSDSSALDNASIIKKENLITKICDGMSSPTSSDEKKLIQKGDLEDESIFNCLAYNDVDERQLYNAEDKYHSDNSLSDSTVTTVSSDFTSVSRLSSMSDSSCGSDLSSDSSSMPKNGELKFNDSVTINHSNNSEDLVIELNEAKESTNSSKNNNHETVFESSTSKSDCEHFFNDFESDENNSVVKVSKDSRSTDCSKININIPSENMYDENASTDSLDECQGDDINIKKSTSTDDVEEKLGNMSLASQSSSHSSLAKAHIWRGQNRFRSKKKELNLTFSREELIRIERDNTILLRKIMSYSKPRSVLLNHAFSHKKTSAAINRARQQKKIEQDNYILYSKINAMNRMKKVF